VSVQLVVVQDERGIDIFFVDFRENGELADSRWFETERDAREFLALNGGDRCAA
jgi:hypothetical protein